LKYTKWDTAEIVEIFHSKKALKGMDPSSDDSSSSMSTVEREELE